MYTYSIKSSKWDVFFEHQICMLNLLDKKILFHLLETCHLKRFIPSPETWTIQYAKFTETCRRFLPGRVAQSVTCLATDASLTADPGVASSIPTQSKTSVYIDHEIISYGHSLPFGWIIPEGLLSVTRESIWTKYWLTAFNLAQEKVWLVNWPSRHDHSYWLGT